MPQATEIIRQMADNDLKLVWYHASGSGKRNLDLVELQTTSARALNTASLGFKGPTTVPRELLNELLQLKFVEKSPASDASHSTFLLSEAGRVRALELRD